MHNNDASGKQVSLVSADRIQATDGEPLIMKEPSSDHDDGFIQMARSTG